MNSRNSPPQEEGPTVAQKMRTVLRTVIFVSVLVFCPGLGHAAITVTQDIPASLTCGSNTKTVPVTIGGSDNVIVVNVGSHTVTQGTQYTPTFDGVDMVVGNTQYWASGAGTLRSYYLYNPHVGTHNLVSTTQLSGGCIALSGSTLSGVDTTAATSSANGDINSPATLTTPTPVTGSFVWAGIVSNGSCSPTAGANTVIGTTPESGFCLAYAYTSTPSTGSTADLNITNGGDVAFSSFSFPPSSTPPAPPPSGTTFNIPAVLFSQSTLLKSPSALTFPSPIVSVGQKQGALVYVTAVTGSNPSVSWASSSMFMYASTTNASGYDIFEFYLAHPISGSIVVSGVATSSVEFVSSSVWSYADIVNNVDAFSSLRGGTRAFLNMGGVSQYSSTVVAGFESLNSISSYTLVSSNSQIQYATSSSHDFSLLSAPCGPLSNCPIGYTSPGFSSDGIASLSAITLYATSSTAAATSSVPSIFRSCDALDLSCHFSNVFSFLLVPDPNIVDKFASLTFASSAPFSYVYQTPDIFNALFNTATSGTIGFSVDMGLSSLTGTSSVITIIDKPMLESWPFIALMRTFLGFSMWFILVYSLYQQGRRIFNTDQK